MTMRIIEIKNSQAIIQVNFLELDTIINNYLDQQYMIGYDEGFSDWQRANENANVDDDDSKEN